MVTIIGTKGKKGNNGASPTPGGDGSDATFTQNGQILPDSVIIQVTGGDGGKGGNNTAAPVPGPGANGGNGGNASGTFNGNIINNASTSTLTLTVTAQGGDGGLGGTGNPAGMQGNGGNATVTMSGNIAQPNKPSMSTVDVEAIAIGGQGATDGNASATLTGNVVQVTSASTVTVGAAATVNDPSDSTLHDGDSDFGTKTAIVTGNIVQGAITNVTVRADAKYSNSSATLSGNVVQDSATSGKVTLEATGQHIDIENNKVTVGKNQEFDLTINQLAPAFDSFIKGNEFDGVGTGNTFVFTDNGISGTNTPATSPTPDTIVIDLSNQSFMFDGKNNKLKNFNNVTVMGNNDPTIIGDNNANVLTGGGSDDTISGMGGNDTLRGSDGNDLLTGGAGNDIIDGGAGLFDTAVYSGNFAQYSVTPSITPNLAIVVTDNVAARDGTDTLTNVEYLKFSDGLYDVANNLFIPNATVNHAPAGTNNTVTMLEDNSHTFTTAEFGFTDPGDAPPNNLLAVEITTLPTLGTLTDNGVAVTAGQFVSVADIAANKLVFTPTANANGSSSFTFQVQDDGGTGGGGQDTDQSPNIMGLTITSVNDAPAGTDNTVTMLEDNSHTFTTAEFGFTDPNDSPANALLAVEITTLPTLGTLTDNGVAVTAGQFVSAADIAANKLVFTPTANANGSSSFTFQVQDNGGTLNGGQDTDQSPNTMGLTITSVNDAPAGTNGAVSTSENAAYTFKVVDFGFTDPNDSPANAFQAVEITTLPLPANGTLTDNGVAVTAGQFVSVADIAANKLVFTPTLNFTGSPSFTFQVQDNGGTLNGGQDTDQSPNTLTINVGSVNHAPAGTNNTVTMLEDNSHTFTTAEFGFTDPGDAPPNNLLAVEITTLPTLGTLTDNGVAVTAGQFVSVADIAANKLVFTPTANANGSSSFTFQVQDDGGTGGGGQDTDQSPNIMGLTITSVNDAPAGTDNTVTMLEDNSHTFTTAEFGFTDPNDSPANALLAVEITTLPTLGTLTDNGVAVTAGQFVSAADIAANKLVFTPTANANGSSSFTFQVQDNGGTLNGGQDTDQSPNTMGLTITSVNDAPAGTNNTVTMLEDNSHTFTTAEFGFTDPNDSPANALLAVEITTLPTLGTLTDNGVAVTAGQFVSAADIAANKLVFTPTANANGSSSFTFQVQDNGGTLNGGQDTDQSPNTMGLTITSVNDAPAGTNNTVTMLEDNSHTFTTTEFGFTDPNDSPTNALLAVEITTLPTLGTLTDNGVAVTAGQFVSVADIAANKLVFTPTANANGSSSFTFQVQDDGGTVNGGQDTDQSPNTMGLTITSVNDAPAGTNNTVTMLEDNSHTFTTTEFGFTDPNDSPANALLAVEITTLPTLGTLTDNGVAVTAGQFVSAADIAANKLVFTPTANANGSSSFTFQVQDDGGTLNGGQDTDQSPNTMGLAITSVNDAPAGTDNTINMSSNTVHTFTVAEFGFTDPNDTPPNNPLAVEITTLPANGTLTDNGTPVTAGQFVSVGDITLGLVQYNPGAGAGADFGDFTFQVQDDGGTVNGGQDTDPTPKNMTVNVSPVIVVNPGDSIQAAINAANPGDTILINPGVYHENVVVNKAGLTLQGTGPGVVIEGNFSNANGFGNADGAVSGLATWLQTAPGYIDNADLGVTVTADNVSLNNITVNDFYTAVTVSGPSVSGLSLNGVTMQSSVNGFAKPDDTALNGTSITNSTFNDGYIGAAFYNDQGATGGPGFGQDATDTSITGSTFTNIDAKGVYMETAQGNTTLDGDTMNNVGQYGGVPSFGANGKNGNGIDLNLKYHTYTGNVTIENFHLTDTGASNGQGIPEGTTNQAGAIVVEGRDDAPTYSPLPADVSGLNVTIQDGTIDGTTSTGIRAGEIKATPATNDTGPAVTVDNVTITGATVSQIDNNTDSLMTVNGTTGDDTLQSAQFPDSTGSLDIFGLAGNDTLQGGLGDDLLNGGPGNDTLIASPGSDTLNGGGNNDTVDFTPVTNGVNVSLSVTGFQNLGDYGQAKLVNIENLIGTGFADVLTGDAGNNTLQGMGGDDRLVATTGKDTLDGGAGNDTADFSAFAGGIIVNANATGFQTFDGTDQVKLISIENLIGGAGNDTLTGNASNNILIGGAGDDVLKGNGGTLDIYNGGTGNDTITGTNGGTTDVGYFSGLGTAYTITGTLGANGVTVSGTDGTDTLNRVDRVKFLSPAHVSDVDNNGLGDLIYQDGGTGAITVVSNPGGTVATNTLTNSPSNAWQVIGTGQFNPDAAGSNARKAGILLQTGNGDMELITNINGINSVVTPLSSVSGTFTGFTAKGTGDFNGDAASDILLWNSGTQTAEIAFLNQNVGETIGTVDAVTPLAGAPTGGSWAPVSAGDFDGDGKSDILWQNGPGGAVEITLMNGANVVNTGTVPLNTAPGYTAVGTGDFDNDGKSDILFSTAGPGSAAEIWTMNGDSLNNVYDINAPGAGFTLKGAQDINGDGYSDLLWQNGNQVVVTELTAGGNVLNTLNLTTPAGANLFASSGGG